ncbi:MAG: ThuA domain-containing protein [Mucilaginibacter sp.]
MMRNLPVTLSRSVAKPVFGTKQLTLLFILLLVLLTGVFTLKSNISGGNENYSAASAALFPIDTAGIPAVQIFVPGFSVKQLPVSLTNINVLRYGDDGKLYALAYDGHVYVLTDTDGDGLEDKVETWWDKELFRMPVGMVVSKEGIYVSANNEVSLLKDTDHDGKAETKEILTKDWTRPFVYTGTTETGVDAFGIARDKDGSIYFSLGSADFTNAYVVDSTGKSHYDIKSERGTVIKLTPGSSKREIVCTGIRFPVAMAFNEHGDLFASEQEGATWLANGNPLDELLFIQKGRHYGFPPRHPKYLPGVIDEPSVFDYSPQHQSTCGLNFNVSVNGGPLFGPEWWDNNAIVSGFSRGKLYRTELIKTASGYVAKNAIIGSVSSLLVDAAPTPQGGLVLSTHSGAPDWGNGPNARGKLYKIMYTDKTLPQPIATWTSKADQVKVTFDKAVPKDYLNNLTNNIEIEYGEYVNTGDRFEVWRPGYQAVDRQMRALRQKLNVKSVYLSADARTLIINTYTHIEPVTYAIKLPAFANDKKAANSIPQAPYIDLAYNLNGVDVSWVSASGSEKWSGTVPHLDVTVTNAFTKPFPGSESLKTVLDKPGKITWKTKLNLWYMLRPIAQPEGSVDYTWPDENVTLVLSSSAPLDIKAGTATVTPSAKEGEGYSTKITFDKVERKPYELEVAMNNAGKGMLQVSYFTSEDPRPRALQVSRFFAPWVKDIYPMEINTSDEKPELAGGNWSRGKKLFFGEAICSNCHMVGGKGKSIGPDLSNLIFRDYKSVMRDIHTPSAAINPDYIAYTVTLKDKRTLMGWVSSTTDSLTVRDIGGNKTTVPLSSVASSKTLSTSLMPEGLDKMLGPQKMKDLLSYLLTSRKPLKLDFPFIPWIRPGSEVRQVMQNYTPPPVKAKLPVKPLRVLWVAGAREAQFVTKNVWQQNKRDYLTEQDRMGQLLCLADNIKVTKADKWPTALQFATADVVVFFWNYPEFSEANGKQLDAFLQRGGGLVYINQAIKADNAQALAKRTGFAFQIGKSKFREGPIDLTFAQGSPITKGFNKTRFQEESQWQLVQGANKQVNILATAYEDGKQQPQIWTTTGIGSKGKVFVSVPGFWDWSYDDPMYRILLLRGIAWAGGRPTYSYEEVVNMGARVTR